MSLVKKVLDKFGRNLEASAKKTLKRKGKSGGNLEKSLDFTTKETKDGWEFTGVAEDYWEFVDRGVKGVGGSKADGTKWKTKRVTDNKFKYRNKRPPTKAFNKWSIRKGIAPRDVRGRFTTRKSLLHALSISVFHTGIETTHFLTGAAEKLLKEIPNKVIEAYGLDIEDQLEKAI